MQLYSVPQHHLIQRYIKGLLTETTNHLASENDYTLILAWVIQYLNLSSMCYFVMQIASALLST